MISVFDTPNSLASVSYRKTTTKKSNASRVKPRNPARTACFDEDRIDGGIVPLCVAPSEWRDIFPQRATDNSQPLQSSRLMNTAALAGRLLAIQLPHDL